MQTTTKPKYIIHVYGDVYSMSLYNCDSYTIEELEDYMRLNHDLEPTEYEIYINCKS